MADTPEFTPPATAAEDVSRALQNTLKLGGSLVATWGVALIVRILLPRVLGPDRFGIYNFADAFSSSAFILVTLGVDTYIHKEVPLRLGHASEFFGGLLAVRLVVATTVILGMSAVMTLGHRSIEVQHVVFIFAMSQYFMVTNESFAALLHATNSVGELVFVNIGAKILWGALVGWAALTGRGLVAIALGTMTAEALKSCALFLLTRRLLALRLLLNLRIAVTVATASLPFFVNQIAHVAYSRIDASMLSFLASDAEVGYYGAAQNLAGLALVLTPLIVWVLMPLATRAAARSEAELTELIRRSLQLILSLAIPISLMLWLGADTWIAIVFSKTYAPSALTLRILAPMFILTYVAIVSSTCLIRLERAWTTTVISIGGLVLTPLFNLLLVRPAWHFFGTGGAGAGAAFSLVCTETLVTTSLLIALGGRAFDRQNLLVFAKSGACAAAVFVIDRLLVRIGPARFAFDLLSYLGLAIATGALRLNELIPVLKGLIRSRFRHA